MAKDELRHVAEDINEEIHGAEAYVKKAIDHKSLHAEIAKTYADMAAQELEHAQKLYDIGKKMIAEDPQHDLLSTMWEWSRSMMDDGIMRVKAMMDHYNKK